jgi:hypothetical protein
MMTDTCGLLRVQSSLSSIDRSRLTIGSQRCELPEEGFGFAYGSYNYLNYVMCTAGDDTSEPGFYNASFAVKNECAYALTLATA